METLRCPGCGSALPPGVDPDSIPCPAQAHRLRLETWEDLDVFSQVPGIEVDSRSLVAGHQRQFGTNPRLKHGKGVFEVYTLRELYLSLRGRYGLPEFRELELSVRRAGYGLPEPTVSSGELGQ